MTPPLSPDDLIETVELCRESLVDLLDRDWSMRAGELDWTCRQALEHLCTLPYVPTLATRRVDGWPAQVLVVDAMATTSDLLETALMLARVLADVARSAPAETRAFHPAGDADASGFIAMQIDELLIHTYDITQGLGVAFDASEHLSRLVLDRLFPWWPVNEDPWGALLWLNGRTPLPGRPKLGDEWLWHSAPLSEWNGRIPRWDSATNQRVD
jgi:hypothetical protein